MERDCENFSRRDMLKIGSAGLLGLTLPQLLKFESQARAEPAVARSSRRANSVIMVWLSGGPATIDMWDLRPNASEGIRGEFREIPTSADGVASSASGVMPEARAKARREESRSGVTRQTIVRH